MVRDFKNTGITRRIDELGRIVIPKELREIHRLKVGTPMMITVEGDSLVLTKFSTLSIFEEAAHAAAKSLCEITACTVALCDSEKMLLTCGGDTASETQKDLPPAYMKIVDARRLYVSREPDELVKKLFPEISPCAFAVLPLMRSGDILGSVAIFGEKISETDLELLKFAAAVIEKQID